MLTCGTYQVAVIVGGRNFFCGDTWMAATGVDRATTFQIRCPFVCEKAFSFFSFNRISLQNKIGRGDWYQKVVQVKSLTSF